MSKLEQSESGFPQVLYTHIGVEEDCGDGDLNFDGQLKKRFAQVETSSNKDEPEAKNLKLEEVELPPAAIVGDSVVTTQLRPKTRRFLYEVLDSDGKVLKIFDTLLYGAIPAAREVDGHVRACYYSVGEGNKDELLYQEFVPYAKVVETWGSPSKEESICEVCDVETSSNKDEPEAKKLKLEEVELPPAAIVGDSVVTTQLRPKTRRCLYEVLDSDGKVLKIFEKRYEAIPAARELDGGHVRACYYTVGEGNKDELLYQEFVPYAKVVETWGSPSKEEWICEVCDGKHKTIRCPYQEYVRPGEKYSTKLKPGYVMRCKICSLLADEKGGCCGNYSDDWGVPTLMYCLACRRAGDHSTRDCTQLHLLASSIEQIKNCAYDDESPPHRDDWTDADLLAEWVRGLDLGHGLIGDG